MAEKYLVYDVDNLKISQIKWNKAVTAKTESMMSLGNGYLGIRSVDEEVESFNKEDFFVNGVFNKENIEEVTELVNLADLIQTPIYLDGVLFSIYDSDEYKKTLDLKTGILTREIVSIRNNKKVLLKFERFVSQANVNIYGQKISIQLLEGEELNITLFPRINGQVTNSGAQHLKEGLKKRPTLNSVQYTEKTTFSDVFVFHNLFTKVFIDGKPLTAGTDDYIVTMNRRQIGFKIFTSIKNNQTLVLEKMMSVNTSIDSSKKILSDNEVIALGEHFHNNLQWITFDKEFDYSNIAWEDIRKQFSVEIIGDSYDAKYDSLANTFGIFHMNSFVPKNNSNLSVGAKGMSGEGYQGHTFWDTEFFILPNYLFNNPQVARNLLEYRYKGIHGARAKAREWKTRAEESNLIGAQYPWEMAWPTDGEVCPFWGQADVITGKQEPIASRRQEIHVSADIAYAINQYYDFTKDDEFMNTMGYEMIIDTAIFYAMRAEKQQNGTYTIKNVMGPNEYKGEIDNNAYINFFAKMNLDLAISFIDKLNQSSEGQKILKQVYKKIPYEVPIDLIKNVSEKLFQQLPNKEGIIAENDQFLNLNRIDVRPFQLLGDAGKKLFSTKEGHKRLCSQLVKQADVVLLTQLMPQYFTRDVIAKNFDFYEPVTTHDSSLSPTTYAIQAADLGRYDLAYKLYKSAINIDLGENMKSCDAGVHAGSLAAIWQTTVYAFGGLRWNDNKLHFTPKIPDQWKTLKYTVTYQNAIIEVNISKKKFTIQILNNKSLNVNIYRKETEIGTTLKEFEIQND